MSGVGAMEDTNHLDSKNETENADKSAENFQKFMFELFEKNGIINDLRAYLRGHIVNVLKSTQGGETLTCQKHFTQRLELPYQALNVLIAEYLLRLEFSYTLSVFVSEIPLANMVFQFCETLMKNEEHKRLRFTESDVWSILKYLGVKCDSEHASNIVEMYRTEQKISLLMCLIQCTPLYKVPDGIPEASVSQDSILLSIGSDTEQSKTDKCKHYVHCNTCQNKIKRMKDKYEEKKNNIIKRVESVNSMKAQFYMKNINALEQYLIDELFHQVKTVYDKEMEMMKQEEEKRVEKSLAAHAQQLQTKHEQLESSLKAREICLERTLVQKKRFLWKLAQTLREQHSHMSKAMDDVRKETDRLAAKENNLKTQLKQAEKHLRQRGEEMRKQITSELSVLEIHLKTMQHERDTIDKERSKLDLLKHDEKQYSNENNYSETQDVPDIDLRARCEQLTNELNVLKKYIQSIKEPKCLVEVGVMTDGAKSDAVLNNGQGLDNEERGTRVVNDLKKQKNVNFHQANVEERRGTRSRSRSCSRSSSDAGDAPDTQFGAEILRLKTENKRLKQFTKQQRTHIESLSWQQARLQAQVTAAEMSRALAPYPAQPPALGTHPTAAGSPTLAPHTFQFQMRPRTAPSQRTNTFGTRLNASSSVHNISASCCKGAGEQLNIFTNVAPRIVLPGDNIPFIGLPNKYTDNRRYLINQWRTLRHRISPLGGIVKPTTSTKVTRTSNASSYQSRNIESESQILEPSCSKNFQFNREPLDTQHEIKSFQKKLREAVPKSVLKETRDKFHIKSPVTVLSPTSRDKSPTAVLREAKLKLRKLEIEAEAVENSYKNFKRRRDSMRDRELDTNVGTSIDKYQSLYKNENNSTKPQIDIDKYLKEYNVNIGIYKDTVTKKVKPIPRAYSIVQESKEKENYLDKPLSEFRKLYNSERRPEITEINRTEKYLKSPDIATKLPDKIDAKTPEASEKAPENYAEPPEKYTKSPKIYAEPSDNYVNSPDNIPKSPENSVTSPVTNPESPRDIPNSPSIDRVGTSKSNIDSQREKDKEIEFETTNQNIGKTDNPYETTIILETTKSDNTLNYDKLALDNMATGATENQSHNDENLPPEPIENVNPSQITLKNDETAITEAKNVLKVAIESVTEVTNVQINDSASQELLLIVKSPVETEPEPVEKIYTQMTILISPKRNCDNSLGEDVTKDILEPKFQFNKESISSEQMLDISQIQAKEENEYLDDFTADENNSSTTYDENVSPVSLPKTSDDENFWDN